MVLHDDRIMGVDSKIERQIDVSIRTMVENYPILITIECKDKSRPIDLAEVGEFAMLARDVRSNKGVMISTSGFTAAALTFGKAHGLELLNFSQGESSIGKLRTIPFLFIQNAASWSAEVRLLSHLHLASRLSVSHGIELFSEAGDSLGTLASFVAMSGREGKIPNDPGETLLTSSHRLFIKIDGLLVHADVRARVRMHRRFFIHFSKVEEVDMSDATTGNAVRHFLRSGFVYLFPWDEHGKINGWHEIATAEEVAVAPAFTFTNNPSWD